MTDVELARLDVFEGFIASAPHEGVYRRAPVTIRMMRPPGQEPEEGEVQGIMYIANNMEWRYPPSEQYLTAIHVMLRDQRDPEEFSITVRGILSGSALEGANGADTDTCYTLIRSEMETVSQAPAPASEPLVSALYEWRHPGTHSLSIPALCVEVNALRETPWVMPATIKEIVEKLEYVGIRSTAQLAVQLVSQERRNELNRSLKHAGYLAFHEKTLLLFKQVIGV